MSEHACLVTTRIVNLDPPIEDRFSIYSAVFEGNDRRGEASASDYQITECGCMCSGLNVVCGEPGSISYYSDVTTPVVTTNNNNNSHHFQSSISQSSCSFPYSYSFHSAKQIINHLFFSLFENNNNNNNNNSGLCSAYVSSKSI